MRRGTHIDQRVTCKDCPLTYCLSCQQDGCKCGSSRFLYDHDGITYNEEGKIFPDGMLTSNRSFTGFDTLPTAESGQDRESYSDSVNTFRSMMGDRLSFGQGTMGGVVGSRGSDLEVPIPVEPGRFLNIGGSSLGWSEPFPEERVEPLAIPRNIRLTASDSSALIPGNFARIESSPANEEIVRLDLVGDAIRRNPPYTMRDPLADDSF